MERIKKKCKRGQREALLRFLEKLHGLSIALEAAGVALGQESTSLDDELDNPVLSKKYFKHANRLTNLSMRIGSVIDCIVNKEGDALTVTED